MKNNKNKNSSLKTTEAKRIKEESEVAIDLTIATN